MRLANRELPTLNSFDIALIYTYKEFVELEPDWNQLFISSPNALMFQNFQYAIASYETMNQPLNRHLCCITIRKTNMLVLVWPFVIYRLKLWTLIRPLGACSADYVAPLIDSQYDGAMLTSVALNTLRRYSKADLINLPFIRSDTALYSIAQSSKVFGIQHDTAYATSWTSKDFAEGWNAWYNTISKQHVRKHANLGRRLSKVGKEQFSIITETDEIYQLIDLMIEQKTAWIEKNQKDGEWLSSDNYKEFLYRIATSNGTLKIMMFVLKVDETLIAIKFAARSNNILDLIMGSYNERWAKFSPGIRLDRCIMQWAFQQQLNVDFGVGDELYKRRWTNNNAIPCALVQIQRTIWGKVAYNLWKYRKSC